MSPDTSNSLINLGNLSKPANTLIKKVSNAVGGFFEPYQIKRVTKAEAEAAMIKAQSEIEITDLHRRAVHRWIEEEAQRQKNMEAITSKALPQLKEDSNPSAIEDDWIVNFFDKSRIVSDNQMQQLWSRILASEANTPRTYSKRTVNFLSDLDKAEADLFTRLCGFIWLIGEENGVPLVFDETAEIYNRHGIDFASLNHLDNIGLIRFDDSPGTIIIYPPYRKRQKSPIARFVSYYGRTLELEMPQDADKSPDTGVVELSRIGQELAPICGSKPVEGFWDYVKDQWKQYLPKSETE